MSIAIKAAKFQGDPGLFGFLGGVAKKIGGAAFRTFVPGPIKTALSVGAGFLGGRVSAPSVSRTSFALPAPARQRPAPVMPGIGRSATAVTRVPGITGLAQRMIPGGATGFEVPAAEAGALGPKGFHLNKTGYFLQTGEFVEPRTKWVRNRRRNPGNMRAADRAITRIESAKRMASRLGRITVRKKCPS